MLGCKRKVDQMRFFFSGPRIFGIRPGVIFGASDFNRVFGSSRRSKPQNGKSPSNFVYIIEGEAGKHKIGVSSDPTKRISQLQTGSPVALKFAYIGVTAGGAYDIEAQAHALLQNYNTNGEWFRVPSSIAIGVVLESANRLGHQLQQVQPEMVQTVITLSKRSMPTVRDQPTFKQLLQAFLLIDLVILVICFFAG